MSILIIPAAGEASPRSAAIIATLGSWFAARAIAWRVLAVASPQLVAGLVAASAVVHVASDAADDSRALAGVLGRAPADTLAGKPFLCIGPSAQTQVRLAGALQHAGAELLLKPLVIDDWPAPDAGMSGAGLALLHDGMIALGEAISCCRRLQRKQDALSLARIFAHAPLLA